MDYRAKLRITAEQCTIRVHQLYRVFVKAFDSVSRGLL